MSEARYAVGIDLGTTHCVMAAVDLAASDRDDVAEGIEAIPQLTAPGSVEDRTMLPSFLYLPHPDELKPADRVLPWGEPPPFVVGELARALGGRTPIRLVASAKSWLCHPGVDRRAAILPVEAPEEVARVSPLQATVRYLTHLRAAWDHQHPDAPLTDQEVVLTVPASFDPAARELTAEAAATAGLTHLVLLEEPQAALYHWILASRGEWRKQVQVGDIILVIDLGGGTADFSLIAVTERDGSLDLVRVAVGDHILLGGDNMDLALAHVAKKKLEEAGKAIDRMQMVSLTFAARSAKERLLADPSLERAPIALPSRGSQLLGSALRTEVTQDEVSRFLIDGFFPEVARDARPAQRARGALTQLGLPYAQDAAVTRHLAAFLGRQASALGGTGSMLHPTAVLFNGGVMKSARLRSRILDLLGAWLATEGKPAPRVLEGGDLDHAVAVGAAWYGQVRKGRGLRIRGGTARSYYVGIESAVPAVPGLEPPLTALCVAPFGMEEGSRADLPDAELGLVVGEPVSFKFFGSTVRRDDQAGVTLEHWKDGELEELPEIEAALPAEGRTEGDVVPVRLEASVTEVGTLLLEAVPVAPLKKDERWKIELSVRGEPAQQE